jgi:hypothetical protein
VKGETDHCVHKFARGSSDSCIQGKGLIINSNMQLVKTYRLYESSPRKRPLSITAPRQNCHRCPTASYCRDSSGSNCCWPNLIASYHFTDVLAANHGVAILNVAMQGLPTRAKRCDLF